MTLKSILNQIVKKLYPNQPASLTNPADVTLVAKPQYENVDLSLAMAAISELE